MDLRQLLHHGDRLVQRFDRSEWDVSARAARLGDGPEAAFAFVRDRIRYEPYAGALRGAAGTYASRAGNAADRALLLAALLEAKGIPVRFATGRLPQELRSRLFTHAFDQVATARGSHERRLDEGGSFHQRLFRRARHDYEAVRAALGTRLRPVTSPSPDAMLLEMDPHVWVQAQVDGRWVDFDPSLPESEPGRALAELGTTAEQLPPHLFQQVTIRVVAEHLVSGALEPSTRLEVTRRAVDLVDTQLLLMHERPASALGIGSAIAGALAPRTDDRWTPLLWIAGEQVAGTPLDAAAGSFVAEWLEFELTWPGGRLERTRRPLVDRAGAAWRAAARLDASMLRPLQRDEHGALAMQAVHNIWLSAGGHHLADFAEATRLLLLDRALTAMAPYDGHDPSSATEPYVPAPEGDPFAREMWGFVLQNFGAMVWTDHVILPLLNRTPGVRLYPDGPRISVFSSGPVPGGKFVNTVDLRRDGLRGIATDSSGAAQLADLKLRFGLLQGALEHELLAEVTVMAGGDPTAVRSTSSLLAGERLVILPPGTPLGPAGNDATAALAASLAMGRVVVAAPDRLPDTHAWWEVLPETADVQAVADLGLHGSGTPPLDRNNPFVIKRKMQQNPYGGRKTYDARTEREIRRELYEARRAAAERKAAAEAAKYRNGLAQPQQNQPRGGGSEYAVLIVLGALGKIAIDAVSYAMLVKLFEEIEVLVSWLADGGFHAPWP